jgi:hypothetical protein
MVDIYDIMNTLYTLLFKYMIKCIKHGKIRIICRITLDQYHPSGLKALWMILVSRDNTAYDTDLAMYYSLYYNCVCISVRYGRNISNVHLFSPD